MLDRLTKEEVQNRLDENFGKNKVTLISDVVNKRSLITLKCNECGHIWETNVYNVCYKRKEVKQKHCPNCLNKERKEKWIETKCAYCGNKIIRRKCDIKNKNGNVFCNKTCSNRYKNEKREVFSINNYHNKALQYKENKCSCCGWDEDIRILEVHHKDSNRNNNDLSNLIILCPTCHRKITLGLYILNETEDGLISVK